MSPLLGISNVATRNTNRLVDQQSSFTRQSVILRKNLLEWDRVLRTPRGEDWPSMLGRLNAAMHQTSNLDRSIDDVLDHFVYVPRKATANAQDIPFFLSTRLETPSNAIEKPPNAYGSSTDGKDAIAELLSIGDPAQQLAKLEDLSKKIVTNYEERLIRF